MLRAERQCVLVAVTPICGDDNGVLAAFERVFSIQHNRWHSHLRRGRRRGDRTGNDIFGTHGLFHRRPHDLGAVVAAGVANGNGLLHQERGGPPLHASRIGGRIVTERDFKLARRPRRTRDLNAEVRGAEAVAVAEELHAVHVVSAWAEGGPDRRNDVLSIGQIRHGKHGKIGSSVAQFRHHGVCRDHQQLRHSIRADGHGHEPLVHGDVSDGNRRFVAQERPHGSSVAGEG
mmetsp:Transcript_19728/g.61278  ORF Transcript_19728/g.61278 Transcript_19728/m.61278 type:complete len:232 (-) Transcript_19728:366-1061(-)